MAVDSQSKKNWNKDHILFVTTKLFEKGDKDIIDFLEGKARATEIKKALRYYMLHHPEEWKNHPANTTHPVERKREENYQ